MKRQRVLHSSAIGFRSTSKMAAQSYSQGINQQKRVDLFRYSDWLSRYLHLKGQVALQGNFGFVQDKSDLKSASDKNIVRKATVALDHKICEQNITPCCERR